MHHWPGQHGLLQHPISLSAQCSPWTNLSNYGKNSPINTIEVLIAHIFSKEHDYVNRYIFSAQLKNVIIWALSFQNKGADKCVRCWAGLVLSKQRGQGGGAGLWGKVHISQLRTRSPEALYWLRSYSNGDILIMFWSGTWTSNYIMFYVYVFMYPYIKFNVILVNLW